MFSRIWWGCAICYWAGLSFVFTDGIGFGWQLLIGFTIYFVGEGIARKVV